MTIVSRDVLLVIHRAISNPNAYAEGKDKLELRVAFDMFWSQIFTSILGEEPQGRMNARQKLNAAEEESFDRKQWTIIGKLKKAIAASESTLHSKSYSDHGDSTASFISGELRELYEAIDE
jgi:hypothetical protein